MFSLWAKVIRSIHGEDNNLCKNIKQSYPSIWLDIVHEAVFLKNQGSDLCSFIHKKGNGIDTSFWDDVWKGDTNFKSFYSRIYALESCKSITVAEKMSHENLGFSLRRNPRGGIEKEKFKSASHVFFTCHIARVAFHKISNWWDVNSMDLSLYEEPAMLYGSVCWLITKAQANRVEVAELRMLRRRPHIVPLRSVDALTVKALRRRGRLKLRWEDRIKQEMNELFLLKDMILDKNAWRDRNRIGGEKICLHSTSFIFRLDGIGYDVVDVVDAVVVCRFVLELLHT
nr:RNA-directed DNA polymerase, eukaryota, reverse transcriptase zinc-binding domain protein [Tanacetum cinerariifolium]